MQGVEGTQAGSRPGLFILEQLLTACGTAPDWTGANPVVAPEWAPEMLVFTPLGGPVPYSAVLLLFGLLAPTSRSTELELESRNGFHSLDAVQLDHLAEQHAAWRRPSTQACHGTANSAIRRAR